MSDATYSESHPHEPEIAPVLDTAGRCLICLVAHADELVSRAHDIVWAAYPQWEDENGRREPLNAALWGLHELLRGPLSASAFDGAQSVNDAGGRKWTSQNYLYGRSRANRWPLWISWLLAPNAHARQTCRELIQLRRSGVDV